MQTTFLLVDFENVKDVHLAHLPPSCSIKIFLGVSQNNVPFDIIKDAQHFGDNLEWLKISGNGKNNLDFHLAYYLGRLACEFPKAAFVILTKDKGFDALVDHLVHKKVSCRRINDLSELSVKNSEVKTWVESEDLHYDRALEVLTKTPGKNRPKNRKKLTQHISAMFQKKLADKEIERIVDLLFSKKHITETDNVLSYTLQGKL